MPQLFRSRQEFSYWFSNPLNNAVEGKSRLSDELARHPAAKKAHSQEKGWEIPHTHAPCEYTLTARKHASQVKRLHSIMRPFVLRRLKRDVAKRLAGVF